MTEAVVWPLGHGEFDTAIDQGDPDAEPAVGRIDQQDPQSRRGRIVRSRPAPAPGRARWRSQLLDLLATGDTRRVTAAVMRGIAALELRAVPR